MVNRELFEKLWEVCPELRKYSQENNCILCRESNKDTVCHLAGNILNSNSESDVNLLFNIADALVDTVDAYCFCKAKCLKEFNLYNESDADEFFNNHSLYAMKNDWELYICNKE